MAKKVFVSAAVFAASCITAWGQVGTYGTDNNTINISANNSTLTINVEGDATQIADISQKIETAILEGNYSTITVNGGQINSAIVHSILYQKITNQNTSYFKKNEALTTIDLGTTTVTDFTTNTFKYGDNVSAGSCNLETITLPMTNKVDGKMTVPTQVLSFTTHNDQSKVKSVIVPEGYTNIGEKAFYGFNTSVNFDFTISLPKSLKAIDTEAFYQVSKLKDITLPEGLVTIGKRAFKDCTSLTDPKFPSTLKDILSEAYFGIDNIKNIKFNEGIEFIGNSAFYCDHEVKECQKTITFPSSLKYTGPGAFFNRWFSDLYYESFIAPISPIGKLASYDSYGSAYDDRIHMGNNGFNPISSEGNPNADMAQNGYANRENYKNGGSYFAMLHFPKIENIGEINAATYTDITREYATTKVNPNDTFYPAAQLKVGKEEKTYEFDNGQKWSNYCAPGIVNPGYIDTYRGKQYIWPSQSQWMRSFVCNSLGYNWDGVTEYRPTLTDEHIKLMIKDELTIKNAEKNDVVISEDNNTFTYDDITAAEYNATLPGAITTNTVKKEEVFYTQQEADEHNATLTGAVKAGDTTSSAKAYADELSKIAYMGTRQCVFADGNIKEGNKYPIDMKGGKWWTICVPFNMTKKQIDEVFGNGTHVCLFSDVKRDAEGLQKKITLKFVHDVYAHKTLKDADGKYATNFDDNAPACEDDDIVIYAHESYMIYPTKTNEDAVFVVKNYEPIAGFPLPTIVKATDGTEYRFIGNYTTKTGGTETLERIKTITIPQYSYMYAKKKNEPNYKFWFYSGTTMAWKANKCVVQATAKDGGTIDFTNFFGDTTSKAKQVSIFGSDDLNDKPTEIEHVEIIAGEQPKNNIKYDLYGRHVSDNYKGIYIMNGKKYINR